MASNGADGVFPTEVAALEDESPPNESDSRQTVSEEDDSPPNVSDSRQTVSEEDESPPNESDSRQAVSEEDESPPNESDSRKTVSEEDESPPNESDSRQAVSEEDESQPNESDSRQTVSEEDESQPNESDSRQTVSEEDESQPNVSDSRQTVSEEDESPPNESDSRQTVSEEDESPPNESDSRQTVSEEDESLQNTSNYRETVSEGATASSTNGEMVDTGGGYPRRMVANENIDQRFICKICKEIFMEPVQTDCGHRFCRACVNDLIRCSGSPIDCPSCMEEEEEGEDKGKLLAEQLTQDNGVKKEMYEKLPHVVCPDCQWSGTFKDMDKAHWKVCPQNPAWARRRASTVLQAMPKANPKPNLAEPTEASRNPEASTLAAFALQMTENMAAITTQGRRQDKAERNIEHLWQQMEWLQHQNQVLLDKSAECPSYNGLYIWKITNYFSTKQQAIAGTYDYIKIDSPKFYTSRYGYSLMACVYLNGYGKGKGTHMSIFLVICKGDYDALLPWPFAQKVTIKLLSQNGGQDLMQKFTPKGNKSSFQKPISDQNTLVGFPEFVTQVAVEGTFVRDDSLLVRVQVDTSGLTDPAQAMKK